MGLQLSDHHSRCWGVLLLLVSPLLTQGLPQSTGSMKVCGINEPERDTLCQIKLFVLSEIFFFSVFDPQLVDSIMRNP